MPEEVSTALDQNTVFLFANVVALVRCTITFMLTQLDSLILMHLAMGSIIGVMSTWGYRTCRYKAEGVSAMKNFGGVGTHLRVLLNLAACIYGVWFWCSEGEISKVAYLMHTVRTRCLAHNAKNYSVLGHKGAEA